MEEKRRVDSLLVEKGLTLSREKAQALIMAGLVEVNGRKVEKPGQKVSINSQISVKGSVNPYVSRGGLKLEKAFHEFKINVEGKVAIDVGASTGGFTDCLLKHGATRVYAVDVGYGQLAWQLRNDPRVIVLERVNARYLTPEMISEKPSLATIDVSFISLTKVVPAVMRLLTAGADIVGLVKPQFEAGRSKIGKRGVVSDPSVHVEVLMKLIHIDGLSVKGITYSPITGPEGNIEFLIHWKKVLPANAKNWLNDIQAIVAQAHLELGGGQRDA